MKHLKSIFIFYINRFWVTLLVDSIPLLEVDEVSIQFDFVPSVIAWEKYIWEKAESEFAKYIMYSEASLIRTHVWEQIIIVYIESDSLIRRVSYTDSRLGNGGVRISKGSLYKEIKEREV